MPPELEIRRATPADAGAIVDLLASAMGWADDSRGAAFFEWKHQQNPFGPSLVWVASTGGRVVGLRAFLRWAFEHDGEAVAAVRAVDTATSPDLRRQGVFSRLTTAAVDELVDEDVAFVFNTPNERSRAGYLKMGWRTIGRLRPSVRPRGPAALLKLSRARAAADKGSLPSRAGLAAPEALADSAGVAALLAAVPPGCGMRTSRTPAYLAWRYGFPPLGYRAVPATGGVADGLAVFRVRRRGSATEAAICELFAPGGSRRLAGSLVRQVLAESGADYALLLGRGSARVAGAAPLPGQGPVLVSRTVGRAAPARRADWDLSLGDIELY